jgi:hypothetical protein
MRKALIGVFGILLVALCAYALNSCIPFNLAYMKRVKASHLRNDVKEWRMLGGPKSYGHTNETDVSYLWRTNATVGGALVSTVMINGSVNEIVIFWVRPELTSASLVARYALTQEE